MHLRSKPWAGPFIKEHQDLIINQENAVAQKGNWHTLFANDNPIHLEIGSGKGQFIMNMALKYPEINFIGMELQETAVAIAGKKILDTVGYMPKNLRLLYGNGAGVETYFEKEEVQKMYLNFSDPWPKSRHERRRLTYKTFLESYKAILPEHGVVEFKTDNRHLFEYSMVSFRDFGMTWQCEDYSLSLHDDADKVADNVETEYEQKFLAKGQPIYWIRASF